MVRFVFLLMVSALGINICHSQCLSGNCVDGYGHFKLSNGDECKGYFTNKKADGKGTNLFANGEVNTRNLKNGGFYNGVLKYKTSTYPKIQYGFSG